MNHRTALILAGGAALLATVSHAQFPAVPAATPMAAAEAAKRSAWDFNLVAINGKPLPMKAYHGKVVMLVNTASFCGFTPQYTGLEQVYDAYRAKGFTIVGVPSGNFKAQEYESNKEIATFCKFRGVKFPLAERSDVVGPKALPIYRWAAAPRAGKCAALEFPHKYLIGRDGQLIAAFGSKTDPGDPKIKAAIEAALKAPAKA